MGLGDLLKRAFGAVGEFDRKLTYGSDYKEKAATLASLNDLNIRGKLLENQDKFEQIQRMRQELSQRGAAQQTGAFNTAVTLGSSVDPVSSGIVGPPNEANPNDLAGKVVEPPLPSFIKSQIKPEDMASLTGVIQEKRRQRKQMEEQQKKLFEANLGFKNLQDDVEQARIRSLNANADKAERGVVGGGGPRKGADYYVTMNWTDENGVQHTQRMLSSEAAKMGALTTTTGGERKGIKQAVEDLAMAKALGDTFKPEYTDRINNAVQGFRENVPDLGLGLVDEADPEFAMWRANNKKLNNAIIRELSGAQVTPSEYPRITGQLALPEVNATTWLARNRAQQKALEVAIGVQTGKMGVEDARRILGALESGLGSGRGASNPAAAPTRPAPPPGWEYDAGGVLQRIKAPR